MNKSNKVPPTLKRWKMDFEKRSLEEKITFYERILNELQEQSPYPMHHLSNYPAATHWLKYLIDLRVKKMIRDHGEN